MSLPPAQARSASKEVYNPRNNLILVGFEVVYIRIYRYTRGALEVYEYTLDNSKHLPARTENEASVLRACTKRRARGS